MTGMWARLLVAIPIQNVNVTYLHVHCALCIDSHVTAYNLKIEFIMQ